MIVLASKSPRRIEMLKQAGLDFICRPSNIDEAGIIVYPPFTPISLAMTKALHIASFYPNDLVIGADTIISFESKIIGKPKDLNEAKSILLDLSGKTHQVITGICITRKVDHIFCAFAETSNVKFKLINKEIIDEYFIRVNPLDKAGAYAIQEYGDLIIENIEGSRNNIIGFPTEKIFETLDILDD